MVAKGAEFEFGGKDIGTYMKRKKSLLVSQYLERISGNAIEKHQKVLREFARRRHGVYALYRRDRLYYVGLARDLNRRLKHHLRDRHRDKWDRFSIYLTIGDEHIRELESLVVRITQPDGNRQLGKFSRAQDLRRTFARRMIENARRAIDELLGRRTSVLRTEPRSTLKKARKGRTPILSKWTDRGFRLRATFKGRVLRARVGRSGTIRFRGSIYNSPSLAARAAIGRRRAINGWNFRLYERAPGDWVQLDELRR
jgi:hypothetical protein